MAKFFQVAVECPIHKLPVFLIEEAATSEQAKKQVLDKVVRCPLGPVNGEIHNFVVGMRGGEKEVLGVSAYPWAPPTVRIGKEVFGPVSAVPREPLMIAPLKPMVTRETIYYADVESAEKRIAKSEWWR